MDPLRFNDLICQRGPDRDPATTHEFLKVAYWDGTATILIALNDEHGGMLHLYKATLHQVHSVRCHLGNLRLRLSTPANRSLPMICDLFQRQMICEWEVIRSYREPPEPAPNGEQRCLIAADADPRYCFSVFDDRPGDGHISLHFHCHDVSVNAVRL